jgi:hypothetical protein
MRKPAGKAVCNLRKGHVHLCWRLFGTSGSKLSCQPYNEQLGLTSRASPHGQNLIFKAFRRRGDQP